MYSSYDYFICHNAQRCFHVHKKTIADREIRLLIAMWAMTKVGLDGNPLLGKSSASYVVPLLALSR